MVLYSQNVSFLIQDFAKIQRESFLIFLQTGIARQLSKRNPFVSLSTGIEIVFYPASYRLAPPEWTIKDALLRGKTYNCRLYVPVQISDKKKKKIGVQWVLLGHLPLMTKRGHFIINGSPRVVVNQLVRSPGIYYQQQTDTKGRTIYYADIIPQRGTWLRLETDKRSRFWAKMKKTPKISLVLFLEAFCSRLHDLVYTISKPTPPQLDPRFIYEQGKKTGAIQITRGEMPSQGLQKGVSLTRTSVDNKLFQLLSELERRPLLRQKLQQLWFLPGSNPSSLAPAIQSEPSQTKLERGQSIVTVDLDSTPPLESKGCVDIHEVNKRERFFEEEVFKKPEKKKKENKEYLKQLEIYKEQILETSFEMVFEAIFLETRPNPRSQVLTTTEEFRRKRNLLDQADFIRLTPALGRRFMIRKLFNSRTYDLGQTGRKSLNVKLGLLEGNGQLTLTKPDLLFATEYLLKLSDGRGQTDDIDNLKNRRVRTSGELIENQFATGLLRLDKQVRKRVLTTSRSLILNSIITSKPLNGALREFFGGNQLSQYMDQINPLSEITHKRRVSSLGIGGVNRDTAGMDVRGIHPTHYGRICPIETPEGRNAGLVNSLTIFARAHAEGFVLTPFYNVFHGQIQNRKMPRFFAADQEEALRIAPGDLSTSAFAFLSNRPLPIRNMSEFRRVSRQEIDCVGISPLQMISVATSLIPFLEHDDANRALMGSNMQRQALPLLIPERPIVRTGLEGRVASDSGHCLQTDLSGIVSHVTATEITVQRANVHKLTKGV